MKLQFDKCTHKETTFVYAWSMGWEAFMQAWVAVIQPLHRETKVSALGAQKERSGREPDGLARIIHECRREAFETEARRDFSHVRPTQAYLQSVEEAERDKPRRARESDDGVGIHE